MTYDQFIEKNKDLGILDMGFLPSYFELIDDETKLTPKDISEITGVHLETVRRWCRDGRIPTQGVSHYKILGIDVKRFLFQKVKKRIPKALISTK